MERYSTHDRQKQREKRKERYLESRQKHRQEKLSKGFKDNNVRERQKMFRNLYWQIKDRKKKSK